MILFHDMEQFFKSCLTNINHPLNKPIIFDTPDWQRYPCPESRESKTSARYLAHSDGVPVLKFQCMRCEIKQNFAYKNDTFKLTPLQRYSMQLESEKHRASQASLQAANRSKALIEIQTIWDSSKPCLQHEYFKRKQITVTEADGLRLDNQNRIRCPLRNINGDLISIQTIPVKGKKLFHKNTSVGEGFHVLGAIEAHSEIFFAEGIATGLTLKEIVQRPVIVCYGKRFDSIAPIIAKAYPDKRFVFCCDLPSEGERVTSEDNAKKAQLICGGFICLPDFSEIPIELKPEIARSDFNDLICLLLTHGETRDDALQEVRRQIKQNTGDIIMTEFLKNENQSNKNDPQIAKSLPMDNAAVLNRINELAMMDFLEYERLRKEEAEKMGLRSNILDEEVTKLRKKSEEEKSETILFPPIEPWMEEVSLSTLLDEMVSTLKKYISFISEHEPRAIALWIVHTYCIKAAYISPILFITSAEMRSGKSTLLAILQKITFKCLAASSISPSVIYRVIPKCHPTLLCDEADTYLTDKNEDLRGVFNAGHSRDTAGVLRTNPDTLEVERFDAFGPKCLAAIKSLPSTIEDRAIIVKMRRKAKEQKTEKLRLINEQLRMEFHDIQRKCLKFANENIENIKKTTPSIPDQLNDRASDNWCVLLQIAKLAGEQWLKHAKAASLFLSGRKQENKSLGIELLEDIQNIFDGKYKNCQDLTTVELIEVLCQDDEGPWAVYNSRRKDTKITPRQLANLLNPYDITSTNLVRDYSKRPKGYRKKDFDDAFSRYIPSEPPNFAATSATAATTNNDGACGGNEEKNSSAQSCSNTLLKGSEAASSGFERLLSETKKASEAPSNRSVAAVADKNAILGVWGEDYVDV